MLFCSFDCDTIPLPSLQAQSGEPSCALFTMAFNAYLSDSVGLTAHQHNCCTARLYLASVPELKKYFLVFVTIERKMSECVQQVVCMLKVAKKENTKSNSEKITAS